MNFEYNLVNDQLYLSPTKLAGDFSFLGFGFRKTQNNHLKHISQILGDLNEDLALKLLEVEASRYPNSTLYDELHKLNPEFTIHPGKELIFFGGSFNPWHSGHSACLNLLGSKKCLVLPDRNPFKEIHPTPPLETYLEIMSHLNLDYHYLNPEFILKNEKNPTYYWIERTHQRSPQTKLGLLMGMDSLESIESWHRADDLLKILDTIYVVSRMENEEIRKDLKNRLKKYKNLKLCYLGHHPFESLSSTEIRKQK